MATVETRRITKRFEGHTAVDGIDLLVRQGEFLVLVGPSGCGKTTLLRMLAGLETPTSGDVVIDGRVVTQLPPRARNIAMVFQSYALYPHLTVFKNIAFPLGAVGMPHAEVLKKVEWAAGLFGIQRLLQRKPRQLSGGERQRVALARAVVREPVVFLLDEPLSNLDAKLRTTARDELQQFQRRLGTTTVYVTHDQVEAMGLGDRIAVLNNGAIHQLGTPLEVYGDPADTFVATFIGSPPMNLIETDELVTGFRPEHCLPRDNFGKDEAVRSMPMRVHRVEYLGADRLVYGVLESPSPDSRAIARLPSSVPVQVRVGERHEFAVRERDLKYFDLATGRRKPAPAG
jgi:multiple sugar transport system ATP-binding protein